MQPARENLPLTALRGLAAAWVVGLHVQPGWFPEAPAGLASSLLMGRTAVDIFFVLSGFILAQVYGGMRFDQTPEFWLRRLCRVYPLHLSVMAVLGLTTLAASAYGGSARLHDWRGFGVVALLLQPFLQDDATWSPPSWSVGVELLCYAIFPLTIRLMNRLPGVLLAGLGLALALVEVSVLRDYDEAIAVSVPCCVGSSDFIWGLRYVCCDRTCQCGASQPRQSAASPAWLPVSVWQARLRSFFRPL